VSENLRDPAFTTGLGLLYYGLAASTDRMVQPARKKAGFFHKLFAGV
jgi:hypothetical protein